MIPELCKITRLESRRIELTIPPWDQDESLCEFFENILRIVRIKTRCSERNISSCTLRLALDYLMSMIRKGCNTIAVMTMAEDPTMQDTLMGEWDHNLSLEMVMEMFETIDRRIWDNKYVQEHDDNQQIGDQWYLKNKPVAASGYAVRDIFSGVMEPFRSSQATDKRRHTNHEPLLKFDSTDTEEREYYTRRANGSR